MSDLFFLTKDCIMKYYFIAGLFLWSLSIHGQSDCFDPIEYHLVHKEDFNKYEGKLKLPLVGNDIKQKAEYFLSIYKDYAYLRHSDRVTYEYKSHNVKNRSVTFVQNLDNILVHNSKVILQFDTNRDLVRYIHYGASSDKNQEGNPVVKRRSIGDDSEGKERAIILKAKADRFHKVCESTETVNQKRELLSTVDNNEGPPTSSAQVVVNGTIYIKEEPDYTNVHLDCNNIAELKSISVGVGNPRLEFTGSSGTVFLRDKNDEIFSSIPITQSTTDEVQCPELGGGDMGGYEEAMCYYHLTSYDQYFDDLLSSLETGLNPLTALEFNPFHNNPGKVGVSGGTLNFGGATANGNPGQAKDMAEDVHRILQGYLEYWWKLFNNDKFPDDQPEADDGLMNGTLDFYSYAYSVNEYDFSGSEIFLWAEGTGLTAGKHKLNFGDNYSTALGNFPHIVGQVWGTDLKEISEIPGVGLSKTEELLTKTIGNEMFSKQTTQMTAAQLFLLEASAEGSEVSKNDLCKIIEIFRNSYGSEIDNECLDWYIRDGAWGTDIGDEPNTLTDKWWISRDFWNRLEIDDSKTHQDAEYLGNTENYMMIEITNKGGLQIEDGELEVYYSPAATSHHWPDHWDIIANPVSLSASYTVHQTEAGEPTRRYRMPWIPPNPQTLPEYEPGVDYHGCLVARLVSDEDPITIELNDVYAGNYVQANNNAAMRNLSIIYVGPGIIGPGGTGSGITKHGLIVRHLDIDNTDPNNIVYPVVPVTDDIGFTVHVDGDVITDPDDITSIGTIQIELPDELLGPWLASGGAGDDITVTGDGVISCTGGNARIRNIGMLSNTDYFTKISFVPHVDLDKEIGFSLIQYGEDDCIIGGEDYAIRPAVDNPNLISRDTDVGSRMLQGQEKENLIARNNESVASDILVYPNPAENKLIISHTDIKLLSYTLYSVSGELIENQVLNRKSNSISISKLESGIYFVFILLESGESEVKKFVKL